MIISGMILRQTLSPIWVKCRGALEPSALVVPLLTGTVLTLIFQYDFVEGSIY
jgi:hypothetical protein